MTTDDIDAVIAGLMAPERAMLLYGRPDWRADDWQDHCGDPNCRQCDGAWIPYPEPRRLSPEDAALRVRLQEQQP